MEKTKLTKKDFERMWGESGPYSQVRLSEETRILDDSISRVFLVVEASINPFTFEFVLKHRSHFGDDEPIQQLLDHAEYRGPFDGYVVSAGEEELRDQKSFELAVSYRQLAVESVLKMHNFVITKFSLGKPKPRGIKVSDNVSVDTEKKYAWDNAHKSIITVDNDSVWDSDSYVGSPAGTKNGKIRYFVVFVLASGPALNRDDIKWSAAQTKKAADKFSVNIENAEANRGYIMLTVLIGPQIAPADFIEECIKNSNKKKALFQKEYFVTNISRPTGKEIEGFLRDLNGEIIISLSAGRYD